MTDPLDTAKPPATLSGIEKAIHECRRCPIGFLENQAVMGEGLKKSALMVVGEQPGDQEDLAGKPFVGPSGQLLDRYLVAIPIADRTRAVGDIVHKMTDDVIWVPLFFDTEPTLINNRLINLDGRSDDSRHTWNAQDWDVK